MEGETEKKGLVDYILKFAGEHKKSYLRSVILALIGVILSLIPYLLMGDMVQKLMQGESDFLLYLKEGLLMAACWVLRVLFHTVSTNLLHRTTFRLLGNVRTALCDNLCTE